MQQAQRNVCLAASALQMGRGRFTIVFPEEGLESARVDLP
jgi:hypothetical protein